MRQPREDFQQALTFRRLHLAAIALDVARPARVGPRLRQRPAHELLAGCEVREPDIEVVLRRVVPLPHAARRASRGAQAQALVSRARASKADDANQGRSTISTKVAVCPGGPSARDAISTRIRRPRDTKPPRPRTRSRRPTRA